MLQYPLCGLAAFEYRGHHQVRSAHHVAAGEYLGVRRLEPGRRRPRYPHPAGAMRRNLLRREPGRRIWQESEGDDDGIGIDGFLGSGNDLRDTAPARTRRPQPVSTVSLPVTTR